MMKDDVLTNLEKIHREQLFLESCANHQNNLPPGDYEATCKLENGFYVTHIQRIKSKKVKWWRKLFWGLAKNA